MISCITPIVRRQCLPLQCLLQRSLHSNITRQFMPQKTRSLFTFSKHTLPTPLRLMYQPPHRHFASPQKPKKQKLKTHKGLAKRIIVTARGFKYKSPNHHHMNTGKRYNRLLRLRKKKIVHEKFKVNIIKKLLPYHAKSA